MGFTLPPSWFAFANISANTTKLVMDKGGWDTIFAEMERRHLIPTSKAGQYGATALLLVAGAFLEWNMKENTAGSKFLKEVLGDAPSELGARITSPRQAHITEITPADTTSVITYVPKQNGPTASEKITDAMNELTSRLKSVSGR